MKSDNVKSPHVNKLKSYLNAKLKKQSQTAKASPHFGLKYIRQQTYL